MKKIYKSVRPLYGNMYINEQNFISFFIKKHLYVSCTPLFPSFFGEVVMHFFEFQTSRVIEFIITRYNLLWILKPLSNIWVFAQVEAKDLKQSVFGYIKLLSSYILFIQKLTLQKRLFMLQRTVTSAVETEAMIAKSAIVRLSPATKSWFSKNLFRNS